MDYKSQLDIYHPDMISAFLETGECQGIPEEIQKFLKQIQWASEIYEYEHNITRCARKLKERIYANQGIHVDPRTCKARIYAAIDYFNIDCNVSIKIWESNYADRYENLATLAASKSDYKTAKICIDAARECRQRSSAIAETENNFGAVFLISNTLTLEDAGFQKKQLKDIARKHNEGFYLKMIDSLENIDREDKDRLKRDAGIIETIIEIDPE